MLSEKILDVMKGLNWTLHGMAPLSTGSNLEHYRHWLEQDLHGEMSYLKEHLSLKEDPSQLSSYFKQDLSQPVLRSALVFAKNYVPHPRPNSAFGSLKTAYYAQGEDYHHWLQDDLEKLAEKLREEYPQDVFLPATDSKPILERDLAARAGLGWVGKNTCLINPKEGSLFLIGEILTSLQVTQTAAPIPDFCGKCQKCLEICPTQAFVAPRVLDARKCISYLTIESRQVPELALREKMQDWFFGCDLCQTTCPWNQKAFSFLKGLEHQKKLSTQERQNLISELQFLLESSGKAIEKKVIGTPLKRAGPFGLRRNALIIIGNLKLQELTLFVEKFVADERLGELAQWTLAKLKPS